MKRLPVFLAVTLVMLGLSLANSPDPAYALDENGCLACHGNPDLTKTDGNGSEQLVNTAAHRFIDCFTCHVVSGHSTIGLY